MVITPKQVAQAIGVSESSVKRWCDSGTLAFVKTAGGHRRIEVSTVIDYCRKAGYDVINPSILGLPSNTGAKALGLTRATELLLAFLIDGDRDESFRVINDLYLSGNEVPLICDGVIAPVFHRIGELWQKKKIDIFQERRAISLMESEILHFRTMLPKPKANAKVAIGATLSADNYSLATRLIDLALYSCGWNSVLLGCGLPTSEIQAAVVSIAPNLAWISIGAEISTAEIHKSVRALIKTTEKAGIDFVIGGRALEPSEVRRGLKKAKYFESVQSFSSWLTS